MTLAKALVLATLAAAGGAAFAEGPTTLAEETFVSTKSRAEVRAETLQAIAEGSLIVGGELAPTKNPAMATKNPLPRDAVRATASAPKLAVWGMTEAP